MTERFVTPKAYLLGYSTINMPGLTAYLRDSGNAAFLDAIEDAKQAGLSEAEILCSFYAKLCYRSLSTGHNVNITKTRDIWDNLVATFDSGHGSVFEHVNFNFVVDQCSRVFTHEWVRHRIGTAHSQTSGRYCRYEFIPLVFDPCLEPVRDLWESHLRATEDLLYLTECQLGLRVPKPLPEGPALIHADWMAWRNDPKSYINFRNDCEYGNAEQFKWVPNDKMPFHEKKKLTSACRRMIPQGIPNEMGLSVNLRALRHVVMMRTAAGAEWEIRSVFGQIYQLVKEKFPLVFHGAQERMVDGALEVYGMKQQPYELTREQVLADLTPEEAQEILAREALKRLPLPN